MAPAQRSHVTFTLEIALQMNSSLMQKSWVEAANEKRQE
jgi:hypothetical protein